MNAPSSTPALPAMASPSSSHGPMYTPLVTPYGIEPQDVPWLADLIARQAVRLLDVRHLQDLTLSVSVGPNCTLHTAQLLQQAAHGPGTTTGGTNYSTTLVALKQYHRPAELIFEVHQLLTTPISQYTNPLLGVVQLGEHGLTCLVVPYHPLGNLRQYITDQRANLTALQQLQIIHDIASGLEFLHQRGIQHLNLHSANVLISLQGMAILTDFGRPNNRAEVGLPPKPTPELERIRSLAVVFLAPEVLASNSYSSRSEVYALGMIMFELLTGKVAFEKDLNLPGLSTRVMFGRQEEIPANISGSPGPAYEALIKDCWKLNPAQRPHLSELKSRLEQLMADCRSKADAPSAQQPSQRPSDSSTRSWTTTSNIITTTVVVPNHARTGADGPKMSPAGVQQHKQQQHQQQQQQQLKQSQSGSTDKPLESWTIGQASSSPTAQPRDAIPISSRALEISSGQRKNSSALQSGQIFIVPSVDKALPPLPNPATIAVVSPPTEPQPAKAPVQQPMPAPSPSTSQEVETQSARSKSPNPFWPIPPNYNPTKPTTVAKPPIKDATESTPEAQAKPEVSTVAPEASPYSATPTGTPTTWPRPPAARSSSSSSNSNSSDVITRSYATAPTATSPSPASVSSVTTSVASASAQSEGKPFPISIPARTTSVIPPGASPKFPAPSSITPDTLFNPGRNTILAAATAERKQLEEGPMPTFFNWRQVPSSMDKDAEYRKIQSAATAVTVTEATGSMTGTAQEPIVVGVRGTAVEHIMTKMTASPLPATETSPPATPVSPTTVVTDRHGRESILIIPVFPEPPTTLHNRRISNMDIRFRQAAVRQYTMPRPQGQQQQHGRAASYENLDAESRISLRNPHRASSIIGVMSPQEAPTSPTGLVTRGAYTPIMSSDDVPTASPSNNIHSAARNGDLLELQQFLNGAMQRSLSSGSGVAKHHPPRQGSAGSQQQQRGLFSSAADILDEFEPIERLPVLCCAAVARKNKYQALNMVLRAGANVEGKEQRGGNTPLHLVCETAPPPGEDLKPSKKSAAAARYTEEENGARVLPEKSGMTTEEDADLSQLSHLDVEDLDDVSDGEVDDESDQGQEAAMRKADEVDEQEQEALDRVKDDLELVFSISTNDDGTSSLTMSRQQAAVVLGGAHYRMKNQILTKGGLEDQIRLLVLSGCPVDTPNHRGETPLLLLLRFHDSMTALATLLRMGANPMHMAPFGPGTNPAEIHVDPKTLMTSPSAQKRMSKRLFSSKPIPLQSPQHSQVAGDEDPNHILVMHGSALPHAAYYLRIKCVRYLLEHEIECSDPAVIEQAIVACQHSVAAKVNLPLVATQRRILRLLEQKWRGQAGQRHRVRVAERTLNRTRKPVRSSALLVALAVSSTASSSSSSSSLLDVFPLGPKEHSKVSGLPMSGYVGAKVGAGAAFKQQPVYPGRTSSSTLGAIPTTHLYATDGPMGPGIEVISQHGFQMDNATPRFQLTDRSMDMNGYDGHGHGAQDWRASAGGAAAHDYNSKSPRVGGQDGEPSGLFRKLRNKARS